MDNLNVHKNEGVLALIHGYRHIFCFCVPYYAIDGAIKFVFDTLQVLIRSCLYNITNGAALLQVIHQSIASIDDFSTYFCHVGFNLN